MIVSTKENNSPKKRSPIQNEQIKHPESSRVEDNFNQEKIFFDQKKTKSRSKESQGSREEAIRIIDDHAFFSFGLSESIRRPSTMLSAIDS